MGKALELRAGELRRVCDPATLGFETTAGLPSLDGIVGQPRAVAALAFGADIGGEGFNLFALGQPGSGRTTLVKNYLEQRSVNKPVPPDLCYVHNFANARRPLPLRLPAGRAIEFKKDIDALVEELRTAIPSAFETEEYTCQHDQVLQRLEEQRRGKLAEIDQLAIQSGFRLVKGPHGLLLAFVAGDKLLTEQELEQLNPPDREIIIQERERLRGEIEGQLRSIREMERGTREVLRSLDTETAAWAARHVLEDLRARYCDQPAVLDYLAALQADIATHADDFRKCNQTETPQRPDGLLPAPGKPLVRYQVNVLVSNAGRKGAPVIVETNPTYHNLIGRIEHQTTWTGVVTDHTMIKAGALDRANGGYLIIPARECLMNPFAWEGLKRALKDGVLRIEESRSELGLVSTVTLDPEPIPLEIRVVLIGSPALYSALYDSDEDFPKLFKLKAEFATCMPRNVESEGAYALFVSTVARQEKTLPFDSTAVARIIEYGSRAAEDRDRLSTCFGEIADLVREAAHLARRNGHEAVTAADVRSAEQARRFRRNLAEERLKEALVGGTVLLETAGAAVGRINGLSITGTGDYIFGYPVRLTATTAPGRRGVVSIEREVALSGPIHGKGVLILGGFLLQKYGQTGPISLSASLVFEQSYTLVEGDSASLAELCVLVSAAAGAPLRQDIAVTGSVNQLGQVQSVGGVIQKIEGFFDLCRAKGLTGTQGVLIPASNRRQLMLRDDVVEAVSAGQFHIWAAAEVDEALELLTGLPAGKPDAQGIYPEGTLNRAVADCLARYRASLKVLGAEEQRPVPIEV
jgi:lon-related putative ATP-dependent protease